MQVKIVKFKLYPEDDPTGYVVGLSVELDNGRSFYRDSLVNLKDSKGKTDEEIAQIAYADLKKGIETTAEVEGAKSSIIGEIITNEI